MPEYASGMSRAAAVECECGSGWYAPDVASGYE